MKPSIVANEKSSKKGVMWCTENKNVFQSVGDYDIKNHIDFFLHWHLVREDGGKWIHMYIRWKWSDSSRGVCYAFGDIVTPSREEGRQAGTMCFLDSRSLTSNEYREEWNEIGFNKNIQMSRVYTPGTHVNTYIHWAHPWWYTHRAY